MRRKAKGGGLIEKPFKSLLNALVGVSAETALAALRRRVEGAFRVLSRIVEAGAGSKCENHQAIRNAFPAIYRWRAKRRRGEIDGMGTKF